jgi:hypothetical protein
MKPAQTILQFELPLFSKSLSFAQNSIDTNIDQIAARGQDPAEKERILRQIMMGKLGEEVTYHAYAPHFPNLNSPDYTVYHKKDKSWEEDLIDPVANVRLAVKTKRVQDANKWGASWIFELTDKKIFGKKGDGQGLDPNQYVCLVLADMDEIQGELVACLNLQWLHDNDMFGPPDRDYLDTKLTVRLDRLEWFLKRKGLTKDALWQLKI